MELGGSLIRFRVGQKGKALEFGVGLRGRPVGIGNVVRRKFEELDSGPVHTATDFSRSNKGFYRFSLASTRRHISGCPEMVF